MQISNHAQQRYAERIMDKDNKSDIAVYIANNREKIETDINKMIEYGDLIYSGKIEKGANTTDVYLKDAWVVLVDPNNKKVITLYSIDLGVGKEFNLQYLNMLLDKLHCAKTLYATKNVELQKVIGELQDQIEENKQKINDYRKIANELEKANENMANVISDYEVQRYVAEADVREIIGVLTGKKIR